MFQDTKNNKASSNRRSPKIFNSQEIAESQIQGINRAVKLSLVVEGKQIKNFNHFTLKQSAVHHHSFELLLPYDVLGSAQDQNLEDAQDFLGKRLTAIFKYKGAESSPERVFVGVILEVSFRQEKGSLGNIVLTGFSPTILLDMAPHVQSFGGSQPTNLNTIADTVIKEALSSSKYDFRVDCDYQKEIGYSAQYNETHYNYLSRMAEAYGEQFYYDGEILHFGKLQAGEKPVELVYGSSVSDINIKMKALHVNPTFYGYNSSSNEKLTTASSQISHKSDIAKKAYDISRKTFQTESKRVAPIKASSFMDISTSQKSTAGSKAAEVFVTSGETSIPFLFPGCTANISMRKRDSNKTSHFTTVMMTEVTHKVDARGNYEGLFEAIAADSGFMPRPVFEDPLAETQIATVVSNSDPDGKGRVQVRFDWQINETSEFIRVMSPDAGSSDKVSKNRGFMSIPEVGDQVMVNFQHNHPDRPFVLGGLFHGVSGGGGGEGNNVMSFSGRSGAELKYDNGAGSMNLKDQGGANMFFDGAGNASLNANTDHTTTIGQNKSTKVGQNQSTSIGQNHSISAGSISVISVGGKEGGGANAFVSMDSGGNIVLECDTNITIKTGSSSITLTSGGDISISGLTVKVTGSTVTEVGKSGANPGIKINDDIKLMATKIDSASSGPTNIKGADVEINKG